MSDKPNPLKSLSQQMEGQPKPSGLPPVDKWNPPFSGDMDLVIKRDGTWLHEGTPFQRKELVRLFSTILKREGDEYFLVTPVEKFRIQVEDVPLHVVTVQETEYKGKPAYLFETMTGDQVMADAEHPIRVEIDPQTEEPSPYILVRSNLEALISRSVFYQLVDAAKVEDVSGGSRLYVESAGQRFELGRC